MSVSLSRPIPERTQSKKIINFINLGRRSHLTRQNEPPPPIPKPTASKFLPTINSQINSLKIFLHSLLSLLPNNLSNLPNLAANYHLNIQETSLLNHRNNCGGGKGCPARHSVDMLDSKTTSSSAFNHSNNSERTPEQHFSVL